MAIRVNVDNIDLREAQEKVDNNLRQVRKMSRKALLAYAGMWGLAFDEAATLLKQGQHLLADAQNRGEKLEAEANQRVQNAREGAESRMRDLEAQVDSLQAKIKNRVQRSEDKIDYDLEAQVERVLNRLGIPSRERIAKLSTEIETLSRKIDQQLTAQPRVVTMDSEPVLLPVEGYDTLTAKEIVAMLDSLQVADLVEIKRYEEAHENRVTVLREVNQRLELMPALDYDHLTVEEVEAKLAGMTDEQLTYLVKYERTHENRVTLLRSLEREQEGRREVVA